MRQIQQSGSNVLHVHAWPSLVDAKDRGLLKFLNKSDNTLRCRDDKT